jgi:hypothetical protein
LIYFRLSSLCYLADSIDHRERLGLKPLRITLIHIILVSDSSGLSRRNLLLRLICSAEIYLLRRTRSIVVLLVLSWSLHHPRLGSDRFPVRSINLSTNSGCLPPSRSDRCSEKKEDSVRSPCTPDPRPALWSSEALGVAMSWLPSWAGPSAPRAWDRSPRSVFGTSPIATRYERGSSVAHDRCSSAPSIRSSGRGERLRSHAPKRPLLVRLAGATPPSIRSSGPSFDLLQVPCVPTDARPQTLHALLNEFVQAGCCFWLLFAHHGKIC